MLGATIFVTVSTSEKAEHIVEAHGIQRERIFDSHNSSFLQAIKHATKGRGVDLVLNFLSGELFTASCECVAPCGKLINLAKRPGGCASQMPLALFEQNVSHIAIDLLEYIRLQPVEGKRSVNIVCLLYLMTKRLHATGCSKGSSTCTLREKFTRYHLSRYSQPGIFKNISVPCKHDNISGNRPSRSLEHNHYRPLLFLQCQ